MSSDSQSQSTSSSSIHNLFQRKDSPEKGRHLVATQKIQQGQLIFIEKPLLSLQSLGNAHQGALVCRCCRAFIGGPDVCVAVASGRIDREKVWDYYKELEKDEEKNNRENILNGIDRSDSLLLCQMVSCRNKCGELFCSEDCEEQMWFQGGHELLCTGLIPESDNNDDNENNIDEDCGELNRQLHPLLQFKVHAVQSNEIFLMVGDLVATVVSLRRQQLENQQLHNEQQLDNGNLDAIMAPYIDFTLKPWWEVATDPLMANPMMLSEVVHLNKTLKELCFTSASLLKEAFMLLVTNPFESKGKNNDLFQTTLKQSMDECIEKYDIFSELFFGKIVGSFEQNALGIRARHPLCRDIIEDPLFRSRRQDDILGCLQDAGMIGEADDGEIRGSNEVIDSEEYTCEEIADFISGLQINEDGYNILNQQNEKNNDEDIDEEDCIDENCNEDKNSGDDLDAIFTPLDGTAMFYTTCKMNHSCSPNVIAKYSYSCSAGGKRTRWGKEYPLVVSCNALRDIEAGEELCISYINSDLEYEERLKALENYGFECNCDRCNEESNSKNMTLSQSSTKDLMMEEEDDPFGSDEEEEEMKQEGQTEVNGFKSLVQLENDLNAAFSSTLESRTPMSVIVPTISLAMQLGSQSLQYFNTLCQKETNDRKINLKDSLEVMLNSLNQRNFVEALKASLHGEEVTIASLHENGGWPDISYREAHRSFSIVASLVHCQNGNFLPAMHLLDKAIILGLSRQDIGEFIEYIEFHASGMVDRKDHQVFLRSIPDYQAPALQELILSDGLSAPIQFPIDELNKDDHSFDFKRYFEGGEPVIIRSFASSWPALQKWRQLYYFESLHGNRIVPIEEGWMSQEDGLKERLMTLKEFTRKYLSTSSCRLVWPLEKSPLTSTQSSIAYLAQHPLFEQISDLLHDIELPSLCGEGGPSNVNAWIGTGGTRTPCHFDTYDNLLVQIVGAKYIRCFHPNQSNKLYVMKDTDSSYGKQGNMSALNCEMEDYDLHPLAKDATYSETVLFPGDCLYIPSGHWHYVRSCSTSASVNFWF